LEKEGWVIIRPQVGVEVAPLSEEEILENLKIRGALEGLAGTEAIQHLREKDFEKLRQILVLMENAPQNNDFQKFIEWNRAFHRMIYQASKMGQLIKTLDQYWDYGKRYRGFYKHLPNILAESNRRHRIILAALKAKNKEIVRTELEKDSWNFGEKLSRYFFNGKP
jgi:DNA-binding GntR family transcriptional regulator